MSTNPFDDENGTFSALTNAEGQDSLWPTFTDVPASWTVVHGPETPPVLPGLRRRAWDGHATEEPGRVDGA